MCENNNQECDLSRDICRAIINDDLVHQLSIFESLSLKTNQCTNKNIFSKIHELPELPEKIDFSINSTFEKDVDYNMNSSINTLNYIIPNYNFSVPSVIFHYDDLKTIIKKLISEGCDELDKLDIKSRNDPYSCIVLISQEYTKQSTIQFKRTLDMIEYKHKHKLSYQWHIFDNDWVNFDVNFYNMGDKLITEMHKKKGDSITFSKIYRYVKDKLFDHMKQPLRVC